MGSARRIGSLSAAALLLMAGAGCGEVQGKLDQARESAAAEWQLAREQAARKRGELEERLREQLGELEPRLAELRERARSLGEGARGEVEGWIDALEARRQAAERALEDLRGSGEQALDRLLREAEAEAESLAEFLRGLRKAEAPESRR